MAMTTYTPSSDRVVLKTRAAIGSASVPARVTLIEYDDRLPIIEVSLYKDNAPYAVPTGFGGNIRVEKRGNYGVMNPVLGCSSDRTKVYVEVTKAMTDMHGQWLASVELVDSSQRVMCAGLFMLDIFKNPVSQDTLEYSSEFKSLTEYVTDANNAANRAEESQRKTEQAKRETEQAAQEVKDNLDTFTTDIHNLQTTKTEKVQIDYDGGVFKLGTRVLNFKDIYEYHITKPDFTFIVSGNRAYLCSFINYPATGLKEMRFDSTINSDGRTKVSSIYITSGNGIDITTVNVSDINGENSSNKVNAITDALKTSTGHYPSVKAMVDYVGGLETHLKSGLIADADYHLGFYLDSNGDLCQKEE